MKLLRFCIALALLFTMYDSTWATENSSQCDVQTFCGPADHPCTFKLCQVREICPGQDITTCLGLSVEGGDCGQEYWYWFVGYWPQHAPDEREVDVTVNVTMMCEDSNHPDWEDLKTFNIKINVLEKCPGWRGPETNWIDLNCVDINGDGDIVDPGECKCWFNQPWGPFFIWEQNCERVEYSCQGSFYWVLRRSDGSDVQLGECLFHHGQNGIRITEKDSQCGEIRLKQSAHVVYDELECINSPDGYPFLHAVTRYDAEEGEGPTTK